MLKINAKIFSFNASGGAILFLAGLFLTQLQAQSKTFTQELAESLPSRTFFLFSLEKPSNTLKQWNQQPLGKLIQDSQQTKVFDYFVREFDRNSENIITSLTLVWNTFELADEGLAFAVLLNSEKPYEEEPFGVLVAKASSPNQIQKFVSTLLEKLIGKNFKQYFKTQTIQGIQVSELSVGFSRKICFSVVDSYCIAGPTSELVVEMVQCLTSKTPRSTTLSQNDSFLKAYTEDARKADFFAYWDIQRCFKPQTVPATSLLSAARISSNETSAIGSLRSVSTSQNQFQNGNVKDRDLDGVGEYGFFTELSGTLPVPVGTEQGSEARPPFVNSVFGTTSQQNGGIATKSGYHFLMYLPSGSSQNPQPIRENGQRVPPASFMPPTEAETDEINAQETRWVCYAWPVEPGTTGNRCFMINQSGEVMLSKNATYNGMNSIPAPNAAYDISTGEDLEGAILTREPAHDGFIWLSTDSEESFDSSESRSPFLDLEEFFKNPLSSFMGLQHAQFLSATLNLDGKNAKDSFIAHFSQPTLLSEVFGKASQTFSSAEICPENTAFFTSVSLSPKALSRLFLKIISETERQNEEELLGQFENTFKFSLVNDFIDLLGEEVSVYAELPEFGVFPKAALMIPLRQPEKFFENLKVLLENQSRYDLQNSDYLNHRFYYLKPHETWFFEPYLLSFTYLSGHLVLSYNPAAIKSLIYNSKNRLPSFASSVAWTQNKAQISGTPEGVLFFNNRKIITASYELLYQVMLVIRPELTCNMPELQEIVPAWNFSVMNLEVTPTQIQWITTGDALGVATFNYLSFQLLLGVLFSTILENKPEMEIQDDPSEPASPYAIRQNENSAIGSLRTLSTSQNQFQNGSVKDRDLDGVGEYGFFTELSGILPVPVGTEQGSEARPFFVNSVFGATSQKNGGIASKNGYYYVIYLPSGNEQNPPIRENGQRVPPSSSMPPTEAESNEINAQECRWVCYAWPMNRGRTGNKCFMINQSGEVIASQDATYSGLQSVPASNACLDTTMGSDIDGSIIMGIPATDGFIWNPTS